MTTTATKEERKPKKPKNLDCDCGQLLETHKRCSDCGMFFGRKGSLKKPLHTFSGPADENGRCAWCATPNTADLHDDRIGGYMALAAEVIKGGLIEEDNSGRWLATPHGRHWCGIVGLDASALWAQHRRNYKLYPLPLPTMRSCYCKGLIE